MKLVFCALFSFSTIAASLNLNMNFIHSSAFFRSVVLAPMLVNGRVIAKLIDSHSVVTEVDYGSLFPSVVMIADTSPGNLFWTRSELDDEDYPPKCSAVRIGPNTMLTAAHCVYQFNNPRDAESGIISYKFYDEKLWYNCFVHSEYSDGDLTHDIAVCRLVGFESFAEAIIDSGGTPKRAVSEPAEVLGLVKYDTIASSDVPTIESVALSMGYGCFETEIVRDLKYERQVSRLHGFSPAWYIAKPIFDDNDYNLRASPIQISRDNSTVKGNNEVPHLKFRSTIEPPDGSHSPKYSPVQFCSGDSGGPLFWVEKYYDYSVRRVIGVNSSHTPNRARRPDLLQQDNTVVSLNDESITDFFDVFLDRRNKVKICGVNFPLDEIDDGIEQCRP